MDRDFDNIIHALYRSMYKIESNLNDFSSSRNETALVFFRVSSDVVGHLHAFSHPFRRWCSLSSISSSSFLIFSPIFRHYFRKNFVVCGVRFVFRFFLSFETVDSHYIPIHSPYEHVVPGPVETHHYIWDRAGSIFKPIRAPIIVFTCFFVERNQ